jgi:hypothetical protein
MLGEAAVRGRLFRCAPGRAPLFGDRPFAVTGLDLTA